MPPRAAPRYLPLALIAALPFAATSCGGEEKKSSPPPSKAPVASSPSTPAYTSQQLEAGAITAKEMGNNFREIPVAIESLKKREVPMCSLTGLKLPGDPEIITRQLINKSAPRDEIKYGQLFARYQEARDAVSAFEAVKKKAKACPPKQNVPKKKLTGKRFLFAHDDTWRTIEGQVSDWTRLRGVEQQTYPASVTKFNVLHYMYDYALRGNAVVTTVYWERTEPKKPGDPIEKRATELLAKQLKKLG